MPFWHGPSQCHSKQPSRELGSCTPTSQHPDLGMQQGVGCLHQELTTRELQGLVTAQSWPVVPLPEPSRQGGQWGKDPSPFLGKTFLEDLKKTQNMVILW